MKTVNPIKLTPALPLLALLAFVGLTAEARGSALAPSQGERLNSSVRPGSKITYFDLLRELFPDLAADGTAHRSVPVRSTSQPRERNAVEGDIKFDFRPYPFKSGGRKLLMLWVEIKADGVNEGTPYEGEAVVLAVYGLGPAFKLLDAVDVKADRFTGFWKDRPLFRMDSRNDAFVVYNTHWNAGESFLGIDMLFVDEGRIKTVASLFLYNTQGCGVGFDETPAFRAAADPGNKYPKVFVSVELKKGRDGETCDHPARGYVRHYRGVYRWSGAKGRYVGGSRQLDRLDKFNGRRVS